MRELHQREPLPALTPLGVSAEIERTVFRATAKRLEDRYQSADEMLEDLLRISATGGDAPTVVLGSWFADSGGFIAEDLCYYSPR